MRKFLAKLFARLSLRAIGQTHLTVRPSGFSVATISFTDGRPKSVALTVVAAGRPATLLFTPADAADLGRRLVRAGATLQEHHA